jgi:membrane protease YdiL (CAAX protease family)
MSMPDSPFEQAQPVLSSPVVLAPVRPGPGILGALGWVAVMLIAQIVIGGVISVPLVMLSSIEAIQSGMRGVPVESGGSGSESMDPESESEGSPDGGDPQPDLVTVELPEAKLNVAALMAAATTGNLLVALAVVLFVFRTQARRVLAFRRLGLLHLLLAVLIVPPLSLVASEVNNWVAESAPAFEELWKAFGELSNAPAALVLVIGCLLPGVGEEIYFRGFLGRGLVARHGVVLGTLLASFLFGAIHLDPVQASGAIVIGLGLQVIYLCTRSLWAPIIVHTLNNAAAFAAPRLTGILPIPGYTLSAETDVAHTPAHLVLAALAALVALGYLCYDSRTRWTLPDGQDWQPGYVTAEEPPAAVGAVARGGRPGLLETLVALIAYLIFALALASVAGDQLVSVR